MKTSRTILITRPNHDVITTYLFFWSELVIKEAQKKNIQILDLHDKKANKKTFTSYVKEHKPIILFFNGHGNRQTIAGYENEALVEINNNEKMLENTIIYARSCNAADELGQSCINNGALSFVGYKRKYVLVYTTNKVAKPLSDQVAKLFLEPSNLIPISLLKGNSVEKAHQKSQEAMTRNFYFMLSTKANQLQKDAAPFLWANKKSQVALGKINSHI